MIPSVNDQKLTTQSFRPTDGKWPLWACDCCQRFYDEQDYLSMKREDGSGATAPIIIEVKEVRYFACSRECARILFNIHHQYAMREPDPEKRFVQLWTIGSERPHLLDLNTVSRMTFEDHQPHGLPPKDPSPNDWVFLIWWTLDSTEPHRHGMTRFYADEMIKKWRWMPMVVRSGVVQ